MTEHRAPDEVPTGGQRGASGLARNLRWCGGERDSTVIDFVERGLRYARRTLSRSRWLGRLPLRLVRAGALPGIGLEPRGAIWVEVDVPDGAGATRTLQLINTHFSLHPRERVMAAEALLGPEWLGHASARHDIVLCGDFNALSWFPSLRRLSRRLADAQTGLDGSRPRPTWFGRYPVGRIDHVLVDSLWTVLHVEVPDDTLARVASDHRPVVVDIAPPARVGNG